MQQSLRDCLVTPIRRGRCRWIPSLGCAPAFPRREFPARWVIGHGGHVGRDGIATVRAVLTRSTTPPSMLPGMPARPTCQAQGSQAVFHLLPRRASAARLGFEAPRAAASLGIVGPHQHDRTPAAHRHDRADPKSRPLSQIDVRSRQSVQLLERVIVVGLLSVARVDLCVLPPIATRLACVCKVERGALARLARTTRGTGSSWFWPSQIRTPSASR